MTNCIKIKEKFFDTVPRDIVERNEKRLAEIHHEELEVKREESHLRKGRIFAAMSNTGNTSYTSRGTFEGEV
ncbi:unnamed protein product [Ceratitis capitata]|uniref:(Mediterranean fruit fly) hypothetical protein n=1 Tax=Ceratitis capitata TaxID=7213 RepID=A0A811UGM2_CERCA|nr:unnamed protein product [Ceratitis capitata]